jgi:hypothetical protein
MSPVSQEPDREIELDSGLTSDATRGAACDTPQASSHRVSCCILCTVVGARWSPERARIWAEIMGASVGLQCSMRASLIRISSRRSWISCQSLSSAACCRSSGFMPCEAQFWVNGREVRAATEMTWTTAERTRRGQARGSGRDADKAIGGMGPSSGNALGWKGGRQHILHISVGFPGGSPT